eukprot:scaffold6355_cov119-Cylindrotheca_fusiformis.AAC.12
MVRMTGFQRKKRDDEHKVGCVKDRYRHMRKLESTTYKRFLTKEPYNGLWRQQIVEWMYTIVSYCNFRHETVATASHFLDLSVAKGLVRAPIDYQISAMTAFHLALKIDSSPAGRFAKLESLMKLGSGGFSQQDVLQMERQILLASDWRLNPPTPNCFLHQYLALLPAGIKPSILAQIELRSLKAIEATVSTDYFSLVDSSMLAYAAILLAFEKLDPTDFGSDLLIEYWASISELTQVERTSHTMIQHTILVDCIMRNLPFPWSEEPVKGKEPWKQLDIRSEKNPQSPKHVSLQ